MSAHAACAYLEPVRAIAADAGKRILEVYRRDFDVTHKHDDSPLTEADRLAHELIVARLHALTPDLPVLSEESASADYAARASWERFWLVDPLDGTREFVSRNDEFTVNIALIEHDRPVLGVVLSPVLGDTYFACQGQRAFLQRPQCQPEPIHARRFNGGRPTVLTSRSHPGKGTEAFLKSLGDCEVVRMGSSLKLCLIAAGAADVYVRLGPTMEWDTAAAQCIVETAGGRITDRQHRPLRYNKTDLHNPHFIVSGAGDYDWIRHVPPSE